MEQEKLAIFDEQMTYIGARTRAEVHTLGFWHKTFHCWFVKEENNQKFLLFQLRSPRKKDFPGKLDITAAGHLLFGETPIDGIREIEEELGISLSITDLHTLGIIPVVITLPNFIDKEFCHVYLYHFSGTMDDFNLQEEEVAGIMQISVEDFSDLLVGTQREIIGRGFVTSPEGKKQNITKTFNLYDFVDPHSATYYHHIIVAAQELQS